MSRVRRNSSARRSRSSTVRFALGRLVDEDRAHPLHVGMGDLQVDEAEGCGRGGGDRKTERRERGGTPAPERRSLVGIEPETDGADVDDILALPGRIELAAQIADLHVDDVGLRHEFEVPDVL